MIVFPNLYEQLGPQLIQDIVIRATGKITSRDRDGNVSADTKIIADEIQVVDDNELQAYQSTGKKMAKPTTPAVGVKATRAAGRRPLASFSMPATTKPVTDTDTAVEYSPVLDEHIIKKLYVLINDPDDHEIFMNHTQACSQYPGITDIVLVLGQDKKSAIKMPFKVDGSDQLIGELVKLLGEDAVVLK